MNSLERQRVAHGFDPDSPVSQRNLKRIVDRRRNQGKHPLSKAKRVKVLREEDWLEEGGQPAEAQSVVVFGDSRLLLGRRF